ncbi:TolB family protein [Sandaracinus amylolyticus]|uniref:TolB family protein n=1 Tax=Sandaracinus amylolyticus TaxID=927083 RepID=UPI001F444D04|nr:hypothetical protein [Sandaracinus amylolyticus]UJR79919.1 Hypothetical protein I5071_19590 [Sandaracinus amylolyticus]
MLRIALVSCLVLALGACGRADAPAARESAPLLDDGEVLLDRRDDGATLIGRLVPVPEGSDADRVLTLGTSGLDGAFDGTAVLDARFVAGGLVVLRADHVLVAHRDGATIELDTQVEGPLSIAGTRVAYVRGEFPELELAIADARSGQARVLTQGMAPAWSPALSPDGSEIVFVSGVHGSPRLHRVDTRGGAPRALPPSERFPTAPVAPRWTADGTLHFEDERGPATIVIGEPDGVLEGAR